MDTRFSHNFYSRFRSQLRVQNWIFVFITPLVGILFFIWLPHSKDIHIDWFSLCLASIAWGAGLTTLTQLLTALRFLRPRIKNQPPHFLNQYPIFNVLKMAKNQLIKFCIYVGSLIMFTIFTFLSSDEPIDIATFFGDFFVAIIGSLIIGFWSALLIDAFIGTFIGKSLIFKFKRSQPDWFFHKTTHHYLHPDPQFDKPLQREDWYNDVTNPASPIHQTTYRHSDYS